MVIEAYKKTQQEQAEKDNPAEPIGLTLQEILADKKHSALFGTMIEQNNNRDLAERIASGTLEAKDVDVLEKERKAFSLKVEQAKNINEELGEEMMSELGKQSPEFQKILGLVTPEKAKRMIENHLEELSVVNPVRFGILSRLVLDRQSFKSGEFKKLDEKVQELCDKKKVDSKEYVRILNIKDEKEKEAEMRKMVTANYSNFLKGVDGFFLGGLSQLSVNELLKQKGEIEKVVAKLDASSKDIGWILAGSIKHDATFREALSREISGAPEKVENLGFKDMKDVLPKNDVIEADWAKFKKNIKNWDTLSDPDKDTKRDEFISGQEKAAESKTKKKAGLWAMIARALFGRNLQAKKATFN